VETQNKGNHTGIGIGVAIVGSTLVGAAVDNLRPEPAPWWAILLLIIGIITLIGGLLVLIIGPKSWRTVVLDLKYGIPFWIHKTYYMKLRKHGPTITNSTPKFSTNTSQTAENSYETMITSTFELSIKPGSKPSRVNINSISVCVEVEKGETEFDRQKSRVLLTTHEYFPQIELNPGGKPWEHEIVITTKCLGGKDSIPHIQTKAVWGIHYISIDLPKIKSIQIHKGIKCPRSRLLINVL
jgi:hypothetical protein